MITTIFCIYLQLIVFLLFFLIIFYCHDGYKQDKLISAAAQTVIIESNRIKPGDGFLRILTFSPFLAPAGQSLSLN